MSRTGYCATTDLLLGQIPLPQYLTKEQAIGDAADEIDAHLGFVYVIPIATDAPVSPVVKLILKRINAALASGRLILQLDSGGEESKLHAYGLSLVTEATKAIEWIASGKQVLPGVPPVNPGSDFSGPLIYNKDAESSVEAFYDRIANPHYQFFPYRGGVPRGDDTFPTGLVAEGPPSTASG